MTGIIVSPRYFHYFQVRETTLEVEFPLIEDQLAEIDVTLQRAEKDLTWNSEGVWEYIQDTRYQIYLQ